MMRLSALCDPESSEDEVNVEKFDDSNCLEETDTISKQYKKKQKPKKTAVKTPKKVS